MAIRKWEFILLKIYVAKLSVPIIILLAMPFRNEPFGLARRDTEFLADNGHVFVIQYRELESRKRRTKEEELSEELGLLSPQFRNGLYEPLRDPRGLHIE